MCVSCRVFGILRHCTLRLPLISTTAVVRTRVNFFLVLLASLLVLCLDADGFSNEKFWGWNYRFVRRFYHIHAAHVPFLAQ